MIIVTKNFKTKEDLLLMIGMITKDEAGIMAAIEVVVEVALTEG